MQTLAHDPDHLSLEQPLRPFGRRHLGLGRPRRRAKTREAGGCAAGGEGCGAGDQESGEQVLHECVIPPSDLEKGVCSPARCRSQLRSIRKVRGDASAAALVANQLTPLFDRAALDLYTLSLNRNPFDATVWCNRAAVRLKREEHGLAIMDTCALISSVTPS